MKDRFTFKVTYSDGSVEFWYNTVSQTIAEMSRLQKLHDNKIEIEFWVNTVSQTISELTRLQKIHNNQIEVELIEE